MRWMMVLTAVLLTGGCCCGRDQRAAPGVRAEPPAYRFVLLRATPLDTTQEGARQILLEASVVTTLGRPGLGDAQRLDTSEAPAWLCGTHMPNLAQDSDSAVLVWPSVVTRDGEEAVIEITGGDAGDSSARGHMAMQISPTLEEDGAVSLRLFYRHEKSGKTVYGIPGALIRGPAGRVFIIEALETP